ncbi:MAG: adenylate/guanylate cyclase domain-containing protein [Pirellulaceae bacterium]
MRYQSKILITLIAVALATNGIAVLHMYLRSKQYLFEQIQSTVLSIAASAASSIDSNALDRLQQGDPSPELYHRLEQSLREIRDANRRPDVYVKFLYTVHGSATSMEQRYFGVDPEEKLEDKSGFGDPFLGSVDQDGVFDVADIFQAAAVDDHFTQDRWGEWITARAPIRDQSGRTIACLGVDVAARDVRRKLDVLWYTGCVSIGLSVALAVAVSLSLARRVTRPLEQIRTAVQRIGTGDLDVQVSVATRDEFGEVAASINSMTSGLREKGVLHKLFAKYVSADVAQKIISTEGSQEAKGVRRRVTVLFSDIRGFTQMSETMPPEEVLRYLDDYFECMIPVILHNHGTLDKFLGDGLMVHFGAVNEDPLHEEHAVRAALEMQEALRALSIRWEMRGRPRFAIGIGINSGIAVVGNVGSSLRMEYTVIGDTVNVASRLEALTKEFGVTNVIGESTWQAVQHRFVTRQLGDREIRGRKGKSRIYTVDAGLEPAPGGDLRYSGLIHPSDIVGLPLQPVR